MQWSLKCDFFSFLNQYLEFLISQNKCLASHLIVILDSHSPIFTKIWISFPHISNLFSLVRHPPNSIQFYWSPPSMQMAKLTFSCLFLQFYSKLYLTRLHFEFIVYNVIWQKTKFGNNFFSAYNLFLLAYNLFNKLIQLIYSLKFIACFFLSILPLLYYKIWTKYINFVTHFCLHW